ncbi:MAG: MtrB/PioB family outer membrane beta-barrel protein [Sulfuritalea sp.]|nr:MtrB/PioB family outer membrane beta-barrel protein [Sulfuritalea sp.]
MKLRGKFNSMLVVVFGMALGASGYFSYQQLNNNARDEVLSNAGVLMETILSARTWAVNEVGPNLRETEEDEDTYVLNLGRGSSDVTTAAGYAQANSGTGGSVPDTWSRLHSLQLFAKWDYSKQITWRFNYLYENLNSYDWALSDVGAQSNAGILLTGQQAPRYSNHVFGVSAVVKSW